MDDRLEIQSGGVELFARVVPLWEELSQYHVKKSRYFSDEIKARRFAMRKNDIETKAHKLQIDLVTNMENQNDIGYCISTISAGDRGEIDSLFIKEPYRRQGIGKRLMVSALLWLAEQGVMDTSVYVAYGNDEATGFYRRFDFYPRNMQLVRKP